MSGVASISPPSVPLRERLVKLSVPGELFRAVDGGRLECTACGHRCRIGEGKDGICRVRFNRNGTLLVPNGYVGALQVDPIEKKPLFHFLPGSSALSFGMLGCDYHCGYCQNWLTSQTLRDPEADALPETISSSDIVHIAVRERARVVTSTYNEPLITSEWAVEIFRKARERGLLTTYVSNGNATPEVLDYLRPWVDGYKVDLKGFRQESYRQLGGVLNRVLDTIVALVDGGIWVEVVTLVVPGMNDSDGELKSIARFLASLSSSIPWHVTAFHSDYRMTGTPRTSAGRLTRAAEIGRNAGLEFVYAGNLPREVGSLEDTRCPSCGGTVIERSGFRVVKNAMIDGCCPSCRARIPGVWDTRSGVARHLPPAHA